jgi:hypothetical protein
MKIARARGESGDLHAVVELRVDVGMKIARGAAPSVRPPSVAPCRIRWSAAGVSATAVRY